MAVATRRKGPAPIPEAERFWPKVKGDDPLGCWLWQAAHHEDGYGRFSLTGRNLTPAHRWAYEALIGPIPEGLHLDHLCRTPACVNPWHLDPVPQRVNNERIVRTTGTQCRKGHLYSETGVWVYGNQHQCKQCERDRRHARTRLKA